MKRSVYVILLCMFLLPACGPRGPSEEEIATRVAEQVAAQLTALAPSATPVPTDTPTSVPTDTPTPTLIPPTPTPVPPTPTPMPPTPLPASPTPQPYGSRQNPVPAGAVGTTPNGWEITVVGFDPDAWPKVYAENQFNDPPRSGNRMIIIRVRATNVAAEDEPAWIDAFDFYLVGSRNILYANYDEDYTCGVVPDELDEEIFRGGLTEGNICFQLPIDETDLRLAYEYRWDGYLFFSVE